MTRTIAIGADHGGFSLKAELVPWLKSQSYELSDLGAHVLEPTDAQALRGGRAGIQPFDAKLYEPVLKAAYDSPGHPAPSEAFRLRVMFQW